jgi:hypothetical protein
VTRPEQDPAVTAADGLSASLTAMTLQLGKLGKRQRRQRRLVIGLVVSICLDLLITAGLGYNTIRQNDVQNGIRASDIRQCQLTNTARAQDIAIWNRLLTIPAGAPSSAAQKSEVADLERLVRAKDKPRDCAAAFRK